jgi:hypothetical protein
VTLNVYACMSRLYIENDLNFLSVEIAVRMLRVIRARVHFLYPEFRDMVSTHGGTSARFMRSSCLFIRSGCPPFVCGFITLYTKLYGNLRSVRCPVLISQALCVFICENRVYVMNAPSSILSDRVCVT